MARLLLRAIFKVIVHEITTRADLVEKPQSSPSVAGKTGR